MDTLLASNRALFTQNFPVQYLGMSMTYSLFEFVREKLDELLEGQPEQTVDAAAAADALKTVTLNTDDAEGQLTNRNNHSISRPKSFKTYNTP